MKKILIICILLLVGCSNVTNEVTLNNQITMPEQENISTENVTNISVETTQSEDETNTVFTGPEYSILFSSERNGDRDLFLMNGDGTNQHPIIDLDSIEGHGDFSPDGYTIVFFSTMDGNRELYTLDIRNPEETLKRLTFTKGDDHLPDFSPDGKRIVFESTRDGNSEIYIMNSDGSNQLRLTDNSTKDKQPKFSPDGHFIGYTTSINGVQYLAVLSLEDETYEPKIIDTPHVGYIDFYDNNHVIFHANSQLYTMNLSTGKKEPFMDDSKTLWIPVYSPDKNWVVFNKEDSFGTGDIFIKNLISDDVFQITSAPNADWGPDFRPIPSQQKVYFDSNRDGDRDIYVYDTYTHELTNLTNNDVEDGIPYLSPDRSEILFYSNRDGDDEIFTMAIDGTNLQQLTFNDSEDRAAAWSHDGQSIAFSSTRDGDREIFIMNRDGSQQTQLTMNKDKDFWPEFSMDDQWITYTYFDSTQDTYRINIENWQDQSSFSSELLLSNCSRCQFSPNGNRIVFSSRINGIWQIALYDFQTKEIIQLTDTPTPDWVPTWIDEDNIVFSRESGYKASIIKYNISNHFEEVILNADSQNWRPVAIPYEIN